MFALPTGYSDGASSDTTRHALSRAMRVKLDKS